MPAPENPFSHPAQGSNERSPQAPPADQERFRESSMHSGFKLAKSAFTLSILAVVAATLSGCGRNDAAASAAGQPPPQVTVAKVLEKPVTEFDEFTGRFEAIDRVEIRPRVNG